MNKNKKIALIISIALVSIILLIGVTYALNYTQTSANQELVLGDIYMHYNEISGLSITDAVPGADYSNYFEFTISGKNTYTKKDIYYDFILNRGDLPTGASEDNRIPDKYLKFKLVSVDSSNQETVIFTDKTYASLNNQRIHVETIEKNTTSEVNKKYRLYMTIDNSLLIGNTNDAVFTFDEFENAVASVKLNVTGDFNEKELPKSAADTIKENIVPYAVSSASDFTGGLVGINTNGTLYNETTSEEVREYRYSGADVDNYIYYNCSDTADGKTYGDLDYDYAANCETWRIVGIFNENGEEFLKIMNNNTLTDIPTNYVIDGTTYKVGYNGTTANWNKYGDDWIEVNNWTIAGLQYYLNTEEDESATPVAGYLSSLSSNAKNLIRETTYYLGNVDYEVSTVKLSYEQERDETRIWEDNQPTWNGKVGLLYPSDYGYSASNIYWETDMYNWDEAESDGVKASSTSWMQKTANHNSYEWFFSPSSYDSFSVVYWPSLGDVNDNYVFTYGCGVREVLNLKSNTKVLKGDGTEDLPYVVVSE